MRIREREGLGQRTEDRGQRTEGGGQRTEDGAPVCDRLTLHTVFGDKKQGLTRRRGDAEMQERVMGKEVSEARDQRSEGRGQRAEDGGPASLPLFPSVEKGSVQKTTDRVSPSIPNPEGIESFSEGLGRPTALPWKRRPQDHFSTLKGLDPIAAGHRNRTNRLDQIPPRCPDRAVCGTRYPTLSGLGILL